MTWNYRLVEVETGIKSEPTVVGVREVFYNTKGQIVAFSEDWIELWALSKTGLKKDIEKMMIAFEKPILKEREIILNEYD